MCHTELKTNALIYVFGSPNLTKRRRRRPSEPDCLYCEVGDYCGYKCQFNGSYANCAMIVCNLNATDCPVDNSLGDCNYHDTCGCWFFMQMYWTSRRPTQHYDAHRWRLVSAHVATSSTIVRKRT